jgi:hypothetical protein
MAVRLTLLLLIVGSVLTAAPDKFSITVSAPKATLKVGADVIIEVVLKNTSSSNLLYSSGSKREDQGETNYKVEVQDETSTRAPETAYGHKLRTGEDPPGQHTVIVGSSVTFEVPPGGTVKNKILVNKLYDLSKPGEYEIHVERLDDADGASIKSNAITITVEK